MDDDPFTHLGWGWRFMLHDNGWDVIDGRSIIRARGRWPTWRTFNQGLGSIKIGSFYLWVSPDDARAIGATHYGRFMGIVPGFIEPRAGLWISRADWLAPVEDVIAFVWVTMRELRGEEPDFMFAVGREIAGNAAK